jgi:hypothetical protein
MSGSDAEKAYRTAERVARESYGRLVAEGLRCRRRQRLGRSEGRGNEDEPEGC